MKYLLAIYADETYWPQLSDDEQQAEMDAYWQADIDATEAGIFVDSKPLGPSTETITVAVRDGEAVVTDGPFAETKEQLGGYYLLDCESHEEAVGFATRIPGARRGYIEVRPVVEYEAPEWVEKALAAHAS